MYVCVICKRDKNIKSITHNPLHFGCEQNSKNVLSDSPHRVSKPSERCVFWGCVLKKEELLVSCRHKNLGESFSLSRVCICM